MRSYEKKNGITPNPDQRDFANPDKKSVKICKSEMGLYAIIEALTFVPLFFSSG